jgi:amidase
MATDLFEMADPQTARVGEEVGATVAELTGNSLEKIDFRLLPGSDLGDVFARLQGREIWDQHGAWVEDNSGFLDDDVRARLERCKSLSSDSERRQNTDLGTRHEFRRQFAEAVAPGTVVVLPVVPSHGPKIMWTARELAEFRTGCFRLTALAGMVGAPQVVWSTRAETGRHVGIGLLTAPHGDHLLLELLSDLTDGSAEIGD